MERIIRQVVTEEMLLGEYLSKILRFTGNQISRLKFRTQGIRVNGEQKRVTYRLMPGDLLELRLEEKTVASSPLIPGTDDLDILREDEDILAVNKPAGLVVHPAHGHYRDTLANQVIAHVQKQDENLCVRSIGRLDKDTSGIVLFAKNRLSAARLSEQRERGILKKTYLAIVSGDLQPDQGMISLPIRKQPGQLMKMEVSAEEGKPAITSYQVRKRNGRYTIAEVQLLTGRTHQIRVHFASLGHPLLGDVLYGGSASDISRAALHAWRAEFLHPISQKKIHLEAPLPEDFFQIDQ